MGLPNINITFKTVASSSIARSLRGIIAIIVLDATASVQGSYALTKAADIPAALAAANKAYVARAFTGNETQPNKVLLYVLDDAASDLSDATDWLATQTFDWLCAPPDCTATQAAELVTWLTSMRGDGATYKAVLPDKAADLSYVVNFTTDGIVVGEDTLTTAQFCSRIAGLIVGTPLTSSVTFVPVPEVNDVTRLSRDAMDDAVDAGELIIFNDGSKVKVGRGVTSLITTTTTPDAFKKIKIMETVDLITADIRKAAEDSYIGRYPNSYDNKLLLVTAIRLYFGELETAGILEAGTSTVDIDADANATWLTAHGTDVSEMSDQEIREANTGDQVYLKASIRILDAIEDIDLDIVI